MAFDRKLEEVKEMTEQEFLMQADVQRRSLPVPRVIPSSNAKIAARLGELLIEAEEARVRGSKKIPLWPLLWLDTDGRRRCTGQLMELGRSCQQSKRLADGGLKENANYGRFFVFTKAPRLNESGEQVMRTFVASDGMAVSVPDTFMQSFQWFDETLFVRSGALEVACAAHPEIARFLTSYGVAHVPELWPQALLDDLYIAGMSNNEIVSKWTGRTRKAGKRKAGTDAEEEEAPAEAEEEEEHDSEMDDFIVDDMPPPKTPKKTRLKHAAKRQKWKASAKQFIDDEAEESE